MQPDLNSIPEVLRANVAHRLAELDASGISLETAASALVATLPLVWACSDFVAAACVRDKQLLEWLATQGRLDAGADRGWLAAQLTRAAEPGDAAFMDGLRRFRRRQLARIAWRDLAGMAAVEVVLHELTLLADVCITAACDRATALLAARHGAPRGEGGAPMPMLVLGMGKLGGGELNFSSDIDLVLLFPEHGETDGPQPLSYEEYFNRVGRRLAQLLGTVTDEGFVYRVDLRLRPFGESGPVVISTAAFEDYLQQHGRDWERYAYVKARPIVGREVYDTVYRDVLRPFVYRRYLDFGVFESLRAMKELIARDVERRELKGNIKLGPGGIREIEFIVQAFQLIRGGGTPRLQTPSLFEALPMLAGQKLLSARAVAELDVAYRYLRRVENRLQQWNDEQTHELPVDAAGRARLALAMQASGWPEFAATLQRHLDCVSGHFRPLLLGPAAADGDQGPRELERLLEPEIADDRRRQLLEDVGVSGVEPVLAQLGRLRDSGYFRRLDANGRRRLATLLPRVLRLVAGRPSEEVALGRVLHVIERIGGRTVYLALLNENAVALQRLVELCAHSGFLSEQIAAFPLLLDELLDERVVETVPTRSELATELRERMAGAAGEDPERQVELLRQFQRAAVFRVAVADLTGRLPIMKVSDRLTDVAELITQQALELSWEQIVARHGRPLKMLATGAAATAGLIVVAYGKFGGIELGYRSDLDLVFLHDSAGDLDRTAGPAVVEDSVFFLRVVQRLVHLLTVHSSAGRLYEVDTRLRPSGKGGLLAQSIDGFAAYQRSEAWTWEHQALLRARAVAGPPELRERFESLRRDLLQHAIRRATLRDDVRAMRQRQLREMARPAGGMFDLKRDPGGITDIEFLAQYWALLWAHRHVEVVMFSDIIRQLESLASADLVPQATVDVLTGAYRGYRQRIHHLSLESRDSVVPDTEFADERARVIVIWRAVMEAPDGDGGSDRRGPAAGL